MWTFGQHDLASYSAEALRGGRVSVAYRVLAIFGLEEHLPIIDGLVVEDAIDEAVTLMFSDLAPGSTQGIMDRMCAYVWSSGKGMGWNCIHAPGSTCDRLRCNVQTN